MKIPSKFMIPATPYKKKHSLRSPEIPNVVVSHQLAEGSFYKIFLTQNNTVLRKSKRPMDSTDEIRILKCLDFPFINKMIRWWVEDSHLCFEMEICNCNLKQRDDKVENFFEKKNFMEGNLLAHKREENKIFLRKIIKSLKMSFEELNGFEDCKSENGSSIFEPDSIVTNKPENIEYNSVDKCLRSMILDNENLKKSSLGSEIKRNEEQLLRLYAKETLNARNPGTANLSKNNDNNLGCGSKISLGRPSSSKESLKSRDLETINLSSGLDDTSISLDNDIVTCLNGDLVLNGEKSYLISALFPSSDERGTAPQNGIFDPFSENFVSFNNSILISEDSSNGSDFIDESNKDIPIEIEYSLWINIMMYQISSALSYIHSKNIVHMDIKPENILITIEDEFMTFSLCDFNISKIGEGHFDLDGDKIYMAPEVLKNRCYFKSDIYSLGLIYLELINSTTLPSFGENYLNLRRNNFNGWKVNEMCKKMLSKKVSARCSAKEASNYFLGEIKKWM